MVQGRDDLAAHRGASRIWSMSGAPSAACAQCYPSALSPITEDSQGRACRPSKAGKIVSHDVDNDLDLDVHVVVCDDVAHTLHIGPVDLRHGPERVGSDSLRLLPDLFEALRDGVVLYD